ncbi:glucosaminidase domain-containing protein [Marinisporobacter balticus]|uniref:N-acetylmuramoyl-L-alanine amidase n=1 Tax=Marinisporobacter balticus TaxID=2018667 RepID=A0A4R2KUM5_9FIRM|nr:glucosaminidase domain-containing protein [Marinisporobacter balticus]TCO74836.1 N-acetylmuramoyl-L-alanine amidase [Marinisporobacter balticus]
MRRFHSYTIESYLGYLKTFHFTRNITDIHLHHTWKPTKKTYALATDKEKVIYGMWRYHTKTLNWKDIGQHVTVSPDGLIWDGRDLNTIPASISGQNKNAFAIEMIGNFDKEQEKLDGVQLNAVKKLIKGLFDLFHTERLVFHREYSNKTCPGTSLNKALFLEKIENKVNLLGKSVATKEQMKRYLLIINPLPKIQCTPDEIVAYYLNEGAIEGVRGDIAFAQALLETGFFKFGGIVLSNQNNYAGLGATNTTKNGRAATFPSPKIGVKAHIQHLKGYASKEPLINPIVDPRYEILANSSMLGSCKYVTDLNGKWAVPGNNYGENILKILDKIRSLVTDEDTTEIWNKTILEENKKLKEENIKILNKVKAYEELLNMLTTQIEKFLKASV